MCVCVKAAVMHQALKKVFFTEARCLSDEASKSFEALFDRLDVNKDGKVDIAELRAGLADMGVSVGADAAQVNHIPKTIQSKLETAFHFQHSPTACTRVTVSHFSPY